MLCSVRRACPMTMTAKGWQPRRLSRGAAGRPSDRAPLVGWPRPRALWRVCAVRAAHCPGFASSRSCAACGASRAARQIRWRRVRSAGRPSDRAARPITAKGWQPFALCLSDPLAVRRNAGQATGRTQQPFAVPLAGNRAATPRRGVRPRRTGSRPSRLCRAVCGRSCAACAVPSPDRAARPMTAKGWQPFAYPVVPLAVRRNACR